MPDSYIDEVVNAKTAVTVFTTNGYQLRGVIQHNSEEYIVILNGGKKKMVYKHAISTIEPI